METKIRESFESFFTSTPNELSEEARKLFDFIMTEFDKRDEYKVKLKELEDENSTLKETIRILKEDYTLLQQASDEYEDEILGLLEDDEKKQNRGV